MTIILTIVFLLLDIISKFIVKKYLILNQSKVIIKNFFNLTYVKNTGAAFSIFSNSTLLVIIVSLIIIMMIILYVYKNKGTKKLEKISYALILGGAIGNLIDRIIHWYVIDFLDFYIFGYNYPIFNLADVFIVVGVIILLIEMGVCYGIKGNGRK